MKAKLIYINLINYDMYDIMSILLTLTKKLVFHVFSDTFLSPMKPPMRLNSPTHVSLELMNPVTGRKNVQFIGFTKQLPEAGVGLEPPPWPPPWPPPPWPPPWPPWPLRASAQKQPRIKADRATCQNMLRVRLKV